MKAENNFYIPYYPCSERDFSTIEKRLASFEKWPDCLVQKPQDLAEAGFYYDGVGDHVRCFQCCGGLCNWEKEDIPWNQHAKWYSYCPYLYLKKNIKYIENKNEIKKTLDIDEDYRRSPLTELNSSELLMELDIVKCVVSIGYSINIAKGTMRRHVTSTG
ncbi:baculoviral IAP repeat-containing protein 3-like [Penaeus japonicus]|uniref:baculoviral IAP repeat-containing protein 3-like n=1 Tax=Penaeus japonicus TaxID=27405 RepID=UPI001C7136BD|nr:baculoviral IAP repeat-containing protein 3-like [Penaeus japonicus]